MRAFVVFATVVLAVPSALLAEPFGVRLTLDSDPSTTVAVSWNSDDSSDRFVAYGTSPDALTEMATAAEEHAMPNPLGTSFSARLTALSPSTTYYYRVGNPGSSFYPSGDPFSFTTLSNDPCEPLRLIVIGDNRSDFDGIGPSALWPGILAEGLAEMPQLMLNTGDMVKNGDDPDEWINFLLDSEVGFASVATLLTMGNHDDDDVHGDQAIYNRLFALPRNGQTNIEDYYSLDVGPLHIISLSTQFLQPGSDENTQMLAWLEADLTANAQPWTVVFFHKAIYSKGNHSTGEEHGGAMNATFIPLFDAYNVDLVFNGHSHDYERYVPTRGVDQAFGGAGRQFPAGDRGAFTGRTEPVPDGHTGTTYVVTGGAGALTATVGEFTCEDVACTFCTGINFNCDDDVFDADQDGFVVYAGEHNFVALQVEGANLSVRAEATETGNSGGARTLDAFEMVGSDFDVSLCGGGDPDLGNPPDPEADMGQGTPDTGTTDDTDIDQSDTSGETPDSTASVDSTPEPDSAGGQTDVTADSSEGAAQTASADSCGCLATGHGPPTSWLGVLAGVALLSLRRKRARI